MIIEMVFAVLLITTSDGKIIEHTPMFDGNGITSLSKCLEEKRKISKSISSDGEQEGIMVSCQSIKVEMYKDCVTPETCRMRIKRIIE